MKSCPVCNVEMKYLFSADVLKKYNVSYFNCNKCGLIQTEKPYWLDEAYSDAIADADTGLVMRNISLTSKLAVLLYVSFDKHGTYLDIAGGYGVLTRLMRDHGFNYYWEDKYCQNLLAKGFEAKNTEVPFTALTAFEVLEHLYNPLSFIDEITKKHNCSNLIFTTELYERENVPEKDWWYYSFATGQHVSFYCRDTLKIIANKLGFNYYSFNGLHVFTKDVISSKSLLKLMTGKVAPLLSYIIKRKLGSRTFSDHIKLLN